MKNVLKFPERSTVEKEAAEWLIKLDGDDVPSPEEREILQEWLNRSPMHREELQDLAKLWGKMNVLTELAVPLGKPKRHLSRTVYANVRHWSSSKRLAALAVTVIVGIAVGTVIWNSPDPLMESNGFYATAVGHQKSTLLSDGSVVLLNTNTQIEVDYGQDYRDVYLLQGEAHFTVARNRELLFRVFAGVGRIDAIGTAFAVYKKGDSVDVTVTEGRVALASIIQPGFSRAKMEGSQPNIAIHDTRFKDLGTLGAGQVATITSQADDQSSQINALDNLRIIEDQDISKRLAWTKGVLLFSGEPLEEVVKEISRYTTVSIEFSDSSVKAIRIGGRFPVGETETMFDALESNFGLQVTRLDHNRVLVSAGKQ